MKIKYINILLITVLVFANACKEENVEPEAEFSAGSSFYKKDANTFFKLENDSLFKYTPSGKVYLEHTIDADMNLSSSELNVQGMISEDFFPDENQHIVSVLGYPVLFQVKGKSDGMVVFTGDSTDYGYSNRYEDFPFAQGNSLNVYNENQTDETDYEYWYSGTFTATLISTNFFYDAEPKELTKTITVEIVRPEDVPIIE